MAHQITDSPSRHTIYHDIDVSVDMNKEMEQNQKGEEQEMPEGVSLIEGESQPTSSLVILLQATTPRGEPLAVHTFTGSSVANFVRGCSGINPVEVEVMTPQDAIVEVEPGQRVGEVAQALHGIHEWEGQVVEISCLLSTRRSVLNIVRECEAGRARLFQLEEAQQQVYHEQQKQQRQMEQFLQQFQNEVRKVEELQKVHQNTTQTIVREVPKTVQEPKSTKPPTLPPFSGADPVPKDEASCEQWVWQLKEATKTHTAAAVRTGMVQSVRGEVREFVSSIGFETSMEDIIEKIEERFGERWTADRLQQEFYQMTQQKGEKIRQFAGRLETKFKKLKERIPGRYDEKILKERLFHGMHQNLRDSIRFCYKQEGTMYAKLFSETLDAEKEKGPESKATTVKIKSATLDQVQGEDSGIQDLKRKLDNLTTVVKSANYGGTRPKQVNNTNNTGNDNRSSKRGPANKEGSQPKPHPNKPSLPFKGKGPAITSAGPFKEGSRPYQCYTCGGWGHSWRQCPSPGGLDWRGLNGSELPPKSQEKDPEDQKKQ